MPTTKSRTTAMNRAILLVQLASSASISAQQLLGAKAHEVSEQLPGMGVIMGHGVFRTPTETSSMSHGNR